MPLLQEKGRFLDYLMEDITAFDDARVAAASRVVHQGCAAVVKECLALSPAHPGKEGERITIEKYADPNQYRLLGKVHGEPPYGGVVVHRGWKTNKIALPRFTVPWTRPARTSSRRWKSKSARTSAIGECRRSRPRAFPSRQKAPTSGNR